MMESSLSNAVVSAHPSPRVLFLGMESNFSYPPLRALLEHGIEVAAVVMPASPMPGHESRAIRPRERPQSRHTALPLLNAALHPSLSRLAWEQQIPLWEVQRLADPETLSVLASYQPDLICVACFSKRIPRVLLELPRLGCLNVHPSLLPAYRGPVPLFWTLRDGCQQGGVTVHLMDEGMDTGAILVQAPIVVPDGISYAELEARCASLGGELLARSAWDLYQGRAVCRTQDEARSSYQPFPSAEDFVVPVEQWSARYVYNFICGVADWGGPITLQTGSRSFVIQEAISYSHDMKHEIFPGISLSSKGELFVPCQTGMVGVRSSSQIVQPRPA
ncbi:MAG: methionyl-tRNA formyltransferase [Ktedonobacteraceae bacterium]|nr:methionyl-tRNA formyltransferase [Ktedonobacteraceae bacterium]